jgi:hypothetical protein
VQLPVHAPLLQTYGHAAPFCQVPSAPQVCGVSPLHVGDAPGVHVAPHVPAAIEPFTHCPVLPHVCGVVPLHRLAFTARQVVPSQQAPWQVKPPEQVALHR